jgi:threonine/homoserine/homoserine lactone efflux protein
MTELLVGLSLGLGAGLAPGPLQTLVVTSTLERGFGAGLRVAVAPLLTDAPIIGLTVALVSSIPDGAMRLLGISGGLIVIVIGGWTVLAAHKAEEPADVDPGPKDLWRGVLVNAISPHPWIFWIGIGAPLLVSAWRRSPGFGVAFLVGFYGMLVGSKVVLAGVVAAGRSRLSPGVRSRFVVGGGLLLMVGGVVLLWEATAGRL